MIKDILVLCTRKVFTTLIDPTGKTFLLMIRVEKVEGNISTHPDRPRVSSHTNDNYCVNVLQSGLPARSQETVQLREILNVKTIQTARTLPVNYSVVHHVPFAQGLSQKKY